MKKKSVKGKKLTADEIADLADQGHDVTVYFDTHNARTHAGLPKSAIVPMQTQRVNIDFNTEMLKEIDAICESMSVSRQGWIKVKLREVLDNHYDSKSPKRTKRKPS